jgi:alkylation response protein AidB-like acyl-CoA dehydrogenase
MSLALKPRPVPGLAAVAGLIAERAARHDHEGSFPHDNIADLHAAGLLDLTVPKMQGGQGAGFAAAAEAILVVGRACASTGLIFGMQLTQHAALARNASVPPTLYARVAGDTVRHGALLNALRVEPELGSPTRGGLPETIVRRQADGSYHLSGRKIYSTGAPGLGWMAVWARDEGDAPRVGPVLVPAGRPGIRIEDTWDHLGLRATGSHDVVFEDVRLEPEMVQSLRPQEAWRQPDPWAGAWNVVVLGALYTGVAQAAAAWIRDFLRRRVPTGLGAPLATLPGLQEKVGAIEALLATNLRLLRGTAADADAGRPPATGDGGLLKTVLVENAVQAVQVAVSLAGNHALSRRNPLERHWRDVQCGRAHVPHADFAYQTAGRLALAEEAG